MSTYNGYSQNTTSEDKAHFETVFGNVPETEENPATYLMIPAPCNLGCESGEFESGALDFGYIVRYACGIGPNNFNGLPAGGMNRACLRTNNIQFDRYWWQVNHENALNDNSGNCGGNFGGSSTPCATFPNIASTIDLITTATIADTDWSTQGIGNPDVTWDPLNENNNHYIRLVHSDGIKQVLTVSANCPIQYTDFNESCESLKFSRTYPTNQVGDAHPSLDANTQYVVEFYTSCFGLLQTAMGASLPLPNTNQFKLRYFVGPTSTITSNCTEYPTFVEYVTTEGGCSFNTGRFTSGANCTPNFTHNYGTNQEVWQHLTQTFTATVTAPHAVFFSPLTDSYIQDMQYQQSKYFIDDVFITPVSQNPISALLSVQGNYGPIINWNGFYQVPLSVFVQTDWDGANSQPVTVQLNLPPGLSIATTGWSNNTYTFQTGTLNNAGTTLNIMLNISSAYNPNNENEISLTTGANTVSGCLNHVPRIALNMTCTPPAVTFASYGYCNTPSIVATVAPVAGVTGTYTQVWDGPGTYAATGLTATNPVSGAYILTLSNGACSQNYTYSYSAPANATTWVGNTTINNETAFDLSSQVVVAQGDIYIEAPYTWNVNATTIYLQPNKRIQVKANGNVVANKGTFTAACPNMWKGFEVLGNANAPEVWLTNLSSSPHGTLDLSECVVSRANCGVFANQYNTLGTAVDSSNHAGGIVKISGSSVFLNNKQDVYFGKTSTLGGGNRVSRISNTSFIIDPNYIGPLPSAARINIVNNAGVRMGNIDIINSDPSRLLSVQSFTGINLFNAKCELICDVNNNIVTTGSDNLIKGFTYGIRASRTANFGSAGQVQRLYNTKFECHRGSYSQGILGLTSHFVGNVFKFLPVGYTTTPNLNGTDISTSYFGAQVVGRYGAYFFGAHNTITFQQNTVIGTYPIDNINAVGLVVNGTGAQLNDYKLNTFRNLSHAVSFYGINRNTIDGTLGAKFSCNTFEGNGKDVILSAPNGSANPGSNSGLGISSVQGSSSQSAGNKFSQNPLFSNDDLEQNYNVVQGHTYYYKNTGTQENLVVTESNFSEEESQFANQCLVTSNATVQSIILLYNNLLSQYQIIKDGGNTPVTVQEIKDATTSGALDLYYSLMVKSPNLSEESIVELVLKEYELSNNLLTLILANNPAAAKSENIKEQLENKMIPLEEWQMQLILAAENYNSDLDHIKAEMSDVLSTYYQLQAAQEDVIRANNDDPALAYAELLGLYDPTICALDWLRIAAIHEQYGDSTERVLALKQFEQSNLCDTQMYNDIETILNLETRLVAWQQNAPQTDPTLLDDLQSTYTNALIPWSSALACAGIELLTGEKIPEPLYYDLSTRSEQVARPMAAGRIIQHELLVASPNPTDDFATITLPDGFEKLNLRLQIFNVLGDLVIETVITQSLTLIDCSQWANGLYTMRVSVSDQLVMTGKLIKQ
jgi:hypothetical protein